MEKLMLIFNEMQNELDRIGKKVDGGGVKS